MSVSPIRLLLSASLILMSQSVLADTIETSSRVTSATVFTDRAMVTREAKLHVSAGSHVVSIINLPAGFNESSLRVQGKADAPVKIGTIEIKRVFLTELANSTEREKQTELEAKIDEKAMLQAEISAVETRITFINRIVSNGADNHPTPDLSKLDFSPDKWTQALSLLQKDMMEAQKDLTTRQISSRKIDTEIARLQSELNQVKTSQAKQRRDAYVSIEADQDTDLLLSMTYQTAGATWHPTYDARLDTSNGALELEQYGLVSQQTGEDWVDANIVLSTAQPANGSEMPRLYSWLVGVFKPVAVAYRQSRDELESSRSMLAGAMKMTSNDANAPAPAASSPSVQAEAIQSTVQSSEYAAEFHVPGHITLKSINDPTKMFIASMKMKAELSAQTTPRLMAQAFLFAKVTNNEDYPLIPGTVAKYRDGGFIGNASLAFLRPKENADLSFGIDDRIKVTYQRTHESIDNPALVVVGDIKVDRQYQTKIVNLHKDPVSITVFEQYPVSNDPDVTAELVDEETTQGYNKDPEDRQGIITWSGTYDAKQEKTFNLGLRVKYPKGKQITGL